jgi:hypothetical protein
MREILSKDNKFVELLHRTNTDFKTGYKELTDSK